MSQVVKKYVKGLIAESPISVKLNAPHTSSVHRIVSSDPLRGSLHVSSEITYIRVTEITL